MAGKYVPAIDTVMGSNAPYHPALLFQFLLLALRLSVMMGIALPYSAPRGWVFVWRYWKARKNSGSG